MSYCDDIIIGDLVCVVSHNLDDLHGWISYDVETGIVISIIEVEHEFYLYDYKTRCYDYVIYWTNTQKIETVPDLLVQKYSKLENLINEGSY